MSLVRLVCLDLEDREAYARYRELMEPILARFGGHFLLDVDVAQAHVVPADFDVGRVLLIRFPDKSTSDAFFADQDYRAARAAWFVPAVRAAKVTQLEV